MREIAPRATLMTPNAPEAEYITGLPIHSPADAEKAAHMLLEKGVQAVLVKGGHFQKSPATDVLVTRESVQYFPGTWHDHMHTHGTGCIYASSIASHLARGFPLAESV